MFWFVSFFFACESCSRTTDPDILDVDGDGFEARDDCDDYDDYDDDDDYDDYDD